MLDFLYPTTSCIRNILATGSGCLPWLLDNTATCTSQLQRCICGRLIPVPSPDAGFEACALKRWATSGVRVDLAFPGESDTPSGVNMGDIQSNTKRPRFDKAKPGKRSFRKALATAHKQGYATYRNQTIHVKREFVPVLGRHAGHKIQGERVGCLPWNCSGLSSELSAGLFRWLEGKPDIRFFTLQETHWGFSNEWSNSGWYLVHSTSGHDWSAHPTCQGKRHQVAGAHPGRLAHMKFKLKHQQFDTVSINQHTLSHSDVAQKTALMKQRRKLWQEMDGRFVELFANKILYGTHGSFQRHIGTPQRCCWTWHSVWQ